MAALREELSKLGWKLTDEGIDVCLKDLDEKEKPSSQHVIKKALNIDLRHIAAGSLPEGINRGQPAEFTGPLVLQLQRIKDVSKSVASQKDTSQSSGSGRRLLRVYVTDGKSHVSAVEIKKIPELSQSHYPPGTKLMIDAGCKVVCRSGFMMLFPGMVTVLGGEVESMNKKSKASSMDKKVTAAEAGVGPPPFIPFASLKKAPKKISTKVSSGEKDHTSKSSENKENVKQAMKSSKDTQSAQSQPERSEQTMKSCTSAPKQTKSGQQLPARTTSGTSSGREMKNDSQLKQDKRQLHQHQQHKQHQQHQYQHQQHKQHQHKQHQQNKQLQHQEHKEQQHQHKQNHQQELQHQQHKQQQYQEHRKNRQQEHPQSDQDQKQQHQLPQAKVHQSQPQYHSQHHQRNQGHQPQGYQHQGHQHQGYQHQEHQHQGYQHQGHQHQGRQRQGHQNQGHQHQEHQHQGHQHQGHQHQGHQHQGHQHQGDQHQGHQHQGHQHQGHQHQGDRRQYQRHQHQNYHPSYQQQKGYSYQREVNPARKNVPLSGDIERSSSGPGGRTQPRGEHDVSISQPVSVKREVQRSQVFRNALHSAGVGRDTSVKTTMSSSEGTQQSKRSRDLKPHQHKALQSKQDSELTHSGHSSRVGGGVVTPTDPKGSERSKEPKADLHQSSSNPPHRKGVPFTARRQDSGPRTQQKETD